MKLSVLTSSCRSLGAVLVLTMAAQSRQLRGWVPDIDDLQTMVIQNIGQWATQLNSKDQSEAQQNTESSLEAAVEILKEVRRKTRIRRLV